MPVAETKPTEVPLLIDRLGIGHPSACHFPELPEQTGAGIAVPSAQQVAG
ncbi:hypothetical protein GCM10027300_28640 [Modestobacter lapidis]